jgi:hypothetical protein
MPAARKIHRLRGPHGAITSVGLAMLAAAVSAGYLAWVWVPVYALHYDVKQVVRDFGNQAVKSSDDASLVARMTERLAALASVPVSDPSGRVASRPLVDVRPQEVTWQREGDVLHVAFAYEREVAYPVLARSVTKVMAVDLSLDVSRPDWGSPR